MLEHAADERRDDTFPKVLRHNARVRGARPAMRLKERGVWRTWTWVQCHTEIRALALALQRRGIERGDKVAIVGTNRPALYWTMTAAQWLRAIPVPVYADAVADEMVHVLADAQVKIAVVQDQEQVDKLLGLRAQLPDLTDILYDEPRGLRDYDGTHLHSLDAVIGEARTALDADSAVMRRINALVDDGQSDDVAIMLYTSGTTGKSKGVVFAAGRCVGAARDTVAFDRLTDRDEQLAYLPLAWVGDNYLNYAQNFVSGACMACPESADTVENDLREIGPTFYFAPPRVLEAMLTRVTIRMEDASRFKRAMVQYFLAHAKQYGEAILDRRPVPRLARAKYALGEQLVYGPLKNVLGFSRVRTAYTAGEAVGAELFAFYRSIGLNVKQLYGQTEAYLYVTAQADGAVRADTVGPAAPNVDIRIAEDGEVQFRSPGQFLHYHNDPQKTRDAVTADGYVRTGDAGFFESDGQLRILDRAKDVGKLGDGTLFAPKFIENKLKFFPNIKEAVAFGDACDFVTVMLNIDLAAIGNWAERNGVSYGSYQELAAHRQVYDMLGSHIEETNRTLAREPKMAGAQIRRFLILHKELDADDGELTRTQKVRRGFIAERYAPLIAGFYSGAQAVDIATDVTFEDGRKGVIKALIRIADVPGTTATPLPAQARDRAA